MRDASASSVMVALECQLIKSLSKRLRQTNTQFQEAWQREHELYTRVLYLLQRYSLDFARSLLESIPHMNTLQIAAQLFLTCYEVHSGKNHGSSGSTTKEPCKNGRPIQRYVQKETLRKKCTSSWQEPYVCSKMTTIIKSEKFVHWALRPWSAKWNHWRPTTFCDMYHHGEVQALVLTFPYSTTSCVRPNQVLLRHSSCLLPWVYNYSPPMQNPKTYRRDGTRTKSRTRRSTKYRHPSVKKSRDSQYPWWLESQRDQKHKQSKNIWQRDYISVWTFDILFIFMYDSK